MLQMALYLRFVIRLRRLFGIAIVDLSISQKNKFSRDVFTAYENEYTIFCPMAGCFELFGLDFIVDSELNVCLLEINPGPDFKQTGLRLKRVISLLFKETLHLVIGKNFQADHMTMVYSKEWSIAAHKGKMKLT